MQTDSIKQPSFETLFNEIVLSINSVIPAQPTVNTSEAIGSTEISIELGVSVGFIGDMKGSLFLKGERETFSSIAELLYGMRLDGEMLTSFTGEVGNMIAGTLSTNLTKWSLKTDITSPVLMEDGVFKVEDQNKALSVALYYENNGTQLDAILMFSNEA
ncbi:chemotaxis protein CheX [Litchfieldia salsa]|uniref:Chemotaxis protein CheX n=1 Tax=Litchfieldia salsa TaxID=930152 RepID=A0A1H0WWB0_9BACI|nr:chemotaxis protein CheX [Litchfieldia salsa]SDP95018.1 chemotaxis protein CheX [Litchfieldia salsa]